MNNYWQMAVRYLQLNKRRSVVTVLGVMVAVTVLYAILNLGWCWLLEERETLREKQDYEIVFLTETEEQVAGIMSDGRVKSALVGQYYDYNYNEPVLYENALYINTTNPYRMEKTRKEMEAAYGVSGKLNSELSATYLQGEEGNMTFITILCLLLVSFIFAIFGVGIVRNSIQLSILEQIKDYGNLRCVGSTKRQLKSVVYIQGAVLELTGNAIGIVSGFILSLLMGYLLGMRVSFHWIPIVPILIAFLGDLYFAMEENCKVIVNLTPVSAIRGEYRIRKEKIKVRRKSIFGRLFGMEGDYAYKSIMRNPGRFHKTVWALGIGVAAFMAIMCCTATINGYWKEEIERCGYYQVYFENLLDVDRTITEVQSNLPPSGILEKVSNLSGLTDAKRIYSSTVLLNDYEENFTHYTEDYLTRASWGDTMKTIFEKREKVGSITTFEGISKVNCYGYDETDYQRYQQVLVDGTLDVSENGLVLVNGGKVLEAMDVDMVRNPGYIDVVYTDYKVGDTIDIVDMKRYHDMITVKLEQLTEEYERELAKLPELTREEKDNYALYMTTPQSELENEYLANKRQVVKECREQLIAEGAFITYTIEGIVSRDVNRNGMLGGGMEFVLPIDRYYAFTGTDESMVTGMQYHFDKFSYTQFFNTVYGNAVEIFEVEDTWSSSEYPWIIGIIESSKNIIWGVMLFVIFVVLMSTFNIINTTASNLHLRRKEFAQLRVIGISKKRLMKMVMLEGVISSIVANIIGILLGVLFCYISVGMVVLIMYGSSPRFPFWVVISGVVISTLITCGAIYVPLKDLKQDIAVDLATGGD